VSEAWTVVEMRQGSTSLLYNHQRFGERAKPEQAQELERFLEKEERGLFSGKGLKGLLQTQKMR